MSDRSRAREVALQLLFQWDQNKTPVPRPAILAFARERVRPQGLSDFALSLYDGVLKHQSEIDQQISTISENWKIHRMLAADRNVLRIGSFELLHDPTREPVAILINEAIELARRFGSKDSPSFINGLLDKIAKLRVSKVSVAE